MNSITVNGCSADYNASRTADLLKNVTDLLDELGVFKPDRSQQVVHFQHPAELEKKLDLGLQRHGMEHQELMKLCASIIQGSVKTNHPYFYNQLYGGVDPYGVAGALITEALNTNQYTFEVAPAMSMCERTILARASEIFGYGTGDGILAPGGSISNMYAMMLARHRLFPEAKQNGISSCKPLVVYTSEEAHYSISKGLNWLGIGTNNVIYVRCDELGRMIPSELEKAIGDTKNSGKMPLMVNATLGTTVLGAIDPLNEIADVCEKHGVWLHADGCLGASLIFSEKKKHLISGIDRSDSLAWNPHKMLGAPLQCAIFLTKHKGLLLECNSSGASYLFQKDKFYDVSYDTGDKSLQCGRKVDAMKFWLMWKARGDDGFNTLLDNTFKNTEYFLKTVSTRDGFRLVIPEVQCTNISFWYIPKKFRGMEETEEWWDQLSLVAPFIKEKVTLAGSLMIGYQPIKHKNIRNFFRLAIQCHPERTFKDMDYVMDQIEKYGEMF